MSNQYRVRAINVKTSNMSNETREKKAISDASAMLQVLQSDWFKKHILNMPDKWRVGCSSNCKLNKLNNEELYSFIMSAQEETTSNKDYEIDFEIRDYYKWNSVVGWMQPFIPVMHVNRKFWESNPQSKRVSNMVHEWFHMLGGRHSGSDFRMSIMYYANFIINANFSKVDATEIKQPKTIKYYKRPWWNLFRKVYYTKVIR